MKLPDSKITRPQSKFGGSCSKFQHAEGWGMRITVSSRAHWLEWNPAWPHLYKTVLEHVICHIFHNHMSVREDSSALGDFSIGEFLPWKHWVRFFFPLTSTGQIHAQSKRSLYLYSAGCFLSLLLRKYLPYRLSFLPSHSCSLSATRNWLSLWKSLLMKTPCFHHAMKMTSPWLGMGNRTTLWGWVIGNGAWLNHLVTHGSL